MSLTEAAQQFRRPGALQLVTRALRQKRSLIAAFFVLSVAYTLLEGVSLGLLIPFFQILLRDEAVAASTLRLGPFTIGGSLSSLLALIFAAVLVKSALDFFSRAQGLKIKEHLVSSCREAVFRRLLSLELGAFYREPSGQAANIIIGELNRAGLAAHSVLKLFVLGLVAFLYGVFLLAMAPQVTLLLGVGCGLIYAANLWFFTRSREMGRRITVARDQLSMMVNECLHGMKLIRLYGRESDEAARFHHLTRQNATADYLAGQTFSGIQPLTQVFMTGLLIVVILAARYLFHINFQTDAPFVLTYLFILFRLFPLFTSLNMERSLYLTTKSGFKSFSEFLKRTEEEESTFGGRPFPGLNQSIQFQNVWFKYPDASFELQDVSFTIPRHSQTAIVGPSGAGKSTLIDLLCGFYRVHKGAVLIDAVPLDELDLRTWRRHLAVVSQETLLFNETVLFNVAYSKPGATREEIVEACCRARCHEFISALPQGYETVIGERGVRLSGGQRQRLSIARAFLSNPEVLILDEATSSLDRESEELVYQAVNELMEGKTVIIIAHRSSAIRGVDQILLLDQGRVVEIGAHEDLLARASLYQRLYH